MHQLLAIAFLTFGLLGRAMPAQAPALEVRATGHDGLLVTSCFVDGSYGYVVGGSEEDGPGVLLRSTMSARNWERVELPGAHRLYGISLPANGYPWVCGLGGSLFRSTNGGRDWDSVDTGLAGNADTWWAAVHFVDGATGYLAGSVDGGMALARTTNRGRAWESLVDRLPPQVRDSGLRALAFPTDQRGFACGEDGVLVRTEDGGATWTSYPTESNAWLKCMSFPTPQVGFVGGSGGTLLRTVDGGESWASIPLPTNDKVNGVAFTSPATGMVALAGEGVLWTSNGGTSWNRLAISGEFSSLSVSPDGTVWLTCGNGRVARIVPGGGTIHGTVQDAEGRPVEGAVVFPCAAATGDPLSSAGGTSLTGQLMAGNSKLTLVHRVTDAEGEFELVLPAGSWRLVAQSWPNRPDRTQPFVHHTRQLDLHGVAVAQVAAGETVDVPLQPLGDAALEIDVDISNNWTVLGLSSGPPHTAALLGFSAWGGAFGRGILGGVRMTSGKTLVRGLPSGPVHVALFQNDNNPSFGTATFELEAGVTRQERLDIGQLVLPEPLVALDTQLKGVDIEKILRSSVLSGFFAPTTGDGGWWPKVALIAEVADRRITLPGGADARCADLLAVMQYRRMKK